MSFSGQQTTSKLTLRRVCWSKPESSFRPMLLNLPSRNAHDALDTRGFLLLLLLVRCSRLVLERPYGEEKIKEIS